MHIRRAKPSLAIVAGAALLAASALSGCSEPSSQALAQEGQMQQAARVETKTVTVQSIAQDESLTGRARAYQISEVRPQVSGLIRERIFTEGEYVEAGDPLYQIENTEYRAAVNSAAASLARAKASAEIARQTADRYERLVDSNAVSRQQYDEALATARQAQADVAMQQAALDNARTQLTRTTISAPISGQIGRSSVTVGALVTQNQQTPLATIRQLDPIYVDLTASSTEMLKWRRDAAAGRFGGEIGSVPVTITLEDGIVYDRQGTLAFTEVSIDETAGTVVIRASVPNPDNFILPGAFIRASLPVGQYDQAILVPQSAVMRTPRGEPFAFVATPEGTAEQRILTVKSARGGEWIVTEGLEEGDSLIVSGLLNLRPGAPVQVISGDATANAAGSGRLN